MSASEKLRALERRIEEHGSPDNDLHGEDLLLALPQVVALVEAAEKHAGHFHAANPFTGLPLHGELAATLAALEEVL